MDIDFSGSFPSAAVNKGAEKGPNNFNTQYYPYAIQ